MDTKDKKKMHLCLIRLLGFWLFAVGLTWLVLRQVNRDPSVVGVGHRRLRPLHVEEIDTEAIRLG